MRRNKKQDRQGIRNIKQMIIGYEKGLKIYSPYGKLIYILKPGFSIDYNELLRQGRQKAKYSNSKRVF